MYHASSLYGCTDYLCPVQNGDVDQCCDQAEFRSVKPCDEDVYDVCMHAMKTEGFILPANHTDAIGLFTQLKRKLTELLEN